MVQSYNNLSGLDRYEDSRPGELCQIMQSMSQRASHKSQVYKLISFQIDPKVAFPRRAHPKVSWRIYLTDSFTVSRFCRDSKITMIGCCCNIHINTSKYIPQGTQSPYSNLSQCLENLCRMWTRRQRRFMIVTSSWPTLCCGGSQGTDLNFSRAELDNVQISLDICLSQQSSTL